MGETTNSFLVYGFFFSLASHPLSMLPQKFGGELKAIFFFFFFFFVIQGAVEQLGLHFADKVFFFSDNFLQ